MWRLSVITDLPPSLHDDVESCLPVDDPAAQPMEDEEDGWWPPRSGTAVEATAPTDPARRHAPGDLDDPATADDPDHVHADLLATSRWGALADKIDRRLTAQSDWPALAAMLQNVHDAGHDVHDLTRQIVIDSPLGALPAQELRYRLVVWLPEPERFVGEGAVNEWTSLRHVPPALNKPARLTIRSVR